MFSKQENKIVRGIIEKTKSIKIIWQLAKSEKDGAVSYIAHYNGLNLEISQIPVSESASSHDSTTPMAPVFDYYLTVSKEEGVAITLKGDMFFSRTRLSFVFGIVKRLATEDSKKESERSDVLAQLMEALN